MKRLLAALALFAAAFTASAQTQPPPQQRALYDEIARADTALFAAFNAGDGDKVEAFFDESLEFFHDKGGLSSRDATMKIMRQTFARKDGLRRDLIPESLEVYPIPNYGAMEIGAHRFCHPENGKDDCGTFRFVHVWKKQADGWKITRVISYGH
jgi:ketosteroid isomerase-like protein